MGLLNTKNPRALQILMTEAIFDIGFPDVLPNEDAETALDTMPDIVSEPVSKADPVPVLRHYGGNKKHILFIVNYPAGQFFSKESELAFVKTLEAMKLTLNDIAVINYASFDGSITSQFIQKELAPLYWVFLGADPLQVGLGEYPDNIWSKVDGVSVLKTHDFDEMLISVEKKRAFWNAVKLINN